MNAPAQPFRYGNPPRGGMPTTRMAGAIPLCKDCTHFRAGSLGEQARCAHPGHGVDLVLGMPYQRPCIQERADERMDAICGRVGREFKHVEQTP